VCNDDDDDATMVDDRTPTTLRSSPRRGLTTTTERDTDALLAVVTAASLPLQCTVPPSELSRPQVHSASGGSGLASLHSCSLKTANGAAVLWLFLMYQLRD
jgi:hypothetical protein